MSVQTPINRMSKDQTDPHFYEDAFVNPSGFQNCVYPLLKALGWEGTEQQLHESLPYLYEQMSVTLFLRVMENLNFKSKRIRINSQKLDSRLLPCLFVGDNGTVFVAIARTPDGIEVYDGVSQQRQTYESLNIMGTAYFFEQAEDDKNKGLTGQAVLGKGWFFAALKKFRGIILMMFVVNFFLSLLALAPPFFVMFVYDKVIGTHSKNLMFIVAIAALIALTGSVVLQFIRSKMLSYVGARLDLGIGNAIMERLLYLPSNFIEGATVGAQISRVKDFDTVREFFTGPIMAVIFDIPFVIVFLVAMLLFAGYLVLVPLTGMLVLIVVGYFFLHAFRGLIERSADLNSKRQRFTLESLLDMRLLKYNHGEKTWAGRFEGISGDASVANYRARNAKEFLAAFSDGVLTLTGLGLLVFGALSIFQGKLTAGILIASMILLWRMMAPIKRLFLGMGSFANIRASVRQVKMLMSIDPEFFPRTNRHPFEVLHGELSFMHINMRYHSSLDPALLGIDFVIKPGAIVALTGPTGSGKSTLLKLAIGLYQPQSGVVRIDGKDIRQINPIELRHVIGYVAQTGNLFYGSINQNFRLVVPSATDEEIIEAAKAANVYDDIMALPEKFNTQIRDESHIRWPISFQQRLMLARCYLKKSKILLIDECVDSLDSHDDELFMDSLVKMKGKITVLLVTHRPSHMYMADQVLVLKEGRTVMAGPPNKVVPVLMEEANEQSIG